MCSFKHNCFYFDRRGFIHRIICIDFEQIYFWMVGWKKTDGRPVNSRVTVYGPRRPPAKNLNALPSRGSRTICAICEASKRARRMPASRPPLTAALSQDRGRGRDSINPATASPE